MIPQGSAVDTVLELKNISKDFPGVKVLKEVNFDLNKAKCMQLWEKTGRASQR